MSQFEQHVRLVMGFPLGVALGQPTCMANLFGLRKLADPRKSHVSAIAAAMKDDPGVFVHWYGKSEARSGRKMGHLNVVGEGFVERAVTARERFYNAWAS